MTNDDKTRLECELLEAQKNKVIAETAVLRNTTLVTEAIKILGSMVLGIGGAIAAFAGFQLAEVKAEKSKLEVANAERERDAVKAEISSLQASGDSVRRERDLLSRSLERVKVEYAEISEKIAAVQKEVTSPAASADLRELEQSVSAADIDLRSVGKNPVPTNSGAPRELVIERLFAPRAAHRGAAYEELMERFSGDPQLTRELIDYSQKHMSNVNGVYNALVVLSHIDHRKLNSDVAAIREFAVKAKGIGPRISARAEKLLERLPR